MVKLVLILGDQLSPDIALREAEKSDVIVMAEVADEAAYVPHHPKKIAFLFSAMRKFANALEADGWTVAYTKLDDHENTGSITGEVIRRAAEYGAKDVLATEPGEFRLIDALNDLPIPIRLLEDDRFVASHADFESWAGGAQGFAHGIFLSRDAAQNWVVDGW